jgi:thioredoxin 1
MSKLITDESGLAKVLKENKSVFLLVYASWCPYSKRFLPIFEEQAENKKINCARVMIDDLEKVVNKYNVNVFPTVLLFENGKVAKRLDGVSGVGLDERELKDLIRGCGNP